MPIEFIVFLAICFALLGACLGSFASAIIPRIIDGKSWAFNTSQKAARSECPKCGHILNSLDLIPIFSYLLQKGCCRYCRETISKRYFLLEIFSAFFAVIIYFIFSFSIFTLAILSVYPFLLSQIHVYMTKRFLSRQLVFIILLLLIIYGIIAIVKMI